MLPIDFPCVAGNINVTIKCHKTITTFALIGFGKPHHVVVKENCQHVSPKRGGTRHVAWIESSSAPKPDGGQSDVADYGWTTCTNPRTARLSPSCMQ